MTAGQEIALEPALAQMLAEHFHDASVGRYMIVARQYLRRRDAVGHLEQRVEPVGTGLIRPHDPEDMLVCAHDVAQQRTEHVRRFSADGTGRRDRDRIRADVGHDEIVQQQSAVGVRIRAHSAQARGGERREAAHERA